MLLQSLTPLVVQEHLLSVGSEALLRKMGAKKVMCANVDQVCASVRQCVAVCARVRQACINQAYIFSCPGASIAARVQLCSCGRWVLDSAPGRTLRARCAPGRTLSPLWCARAHVACSRAPNAHSYTSARARQCWH